MEWADLCQQVIFFRITFLHQLRFSRRNEAICFHNDMEEKKIAFHTETQIDCSGLRICIYVEAWSLHFHGVPDIFQTHRQENIVLL